MTLADVAGKSVKVTRQRESEAQRLQERLAKQNAELDTITRDEMRRIDEMNSQLAEKGRELEYERRETKQRYQAELTQVWGRLTGNGRGFFFSLFLFFT